MKVYRINLIDLPPVYKTSKSEVDSWFLRNPGEDQSVDVVDVIEELDRLNEELEEVETRLQKLERE